MRDPAFLEFLRRRRRAWLLPLAVMLGLAALWLFAFEVGFVVPMVSPFR
jgi:hypothetical protein